MEKAFVSVNDKKEYENVPKLKVPGSERFNPRVTSTNSDNERFFAFESQKAHH